MSHPLKDKVLFPFIAPPNGGKGTQTKRLSERHNLPTFDMGGTFRVIRKDEPESDLAKELQSFMDKGQLVPVETVIKVFEKGLTDLAQENPNAEGFILDGFPRNMDQATALINKCADWQTSIGQVIYLDVPIETIMKRATGRRISKNNEREVYNINFDEQTPKNKKLDDNGNPMQDEYGQEIWLSDVDGAELYIRKDDLPENVENRMTVYGEETEPILALFNDRKELAHIDGNQSVDAVTQAIESVVVPLLKQTV